MSMQKNLILSGLEELVVSEKSNFINVGERTNVTGSKKFPLISSTNLDLNNVAESKLL